VTALNAWNSWTWTKRSTASSQQPLWLPLPHALHRGGRIDRALDTFRRQAPNNSAFPAWDGLLGMNGWGDLWGQGARACLASRRPVKSVRTIFTESGLDAMGWESHLATGDSRERAWRGISCRQGDGWPKPISQEVQQPEYRRDCSKATSCTWNVVLFVPTYARVYSNSVLTP
jgi:hypothetical protein